jgi:spore germination protein KA
MLQKWKASLDRLFDPRPLGKGAARAFSLKYARRGADQHQDLTVHPDLPVPPDTSLQRVKLRTSEALNEIDDTLNILHTDLTSEVEVNLGRLQEALHYGLTSDVVVRRFDMPFTPAVAAYLVFISGVVNADEIDRGVILPLMDLPRGQAAPVGLALLDQVERSLMPGRQTGRAFDLSYAVGCVASGQCALLLETVPGMLVIDERKYPGRGVEPPTAEQVVRGPQEGFTETILTNTALLRRRLKSPDLIFESAEVGVRSRTLVMIGYLHGVVNPALVAEVRRRLQGLLVDSVQASGTLEQLLEDSPLGIFPTMQETQRPDRAAASISEGRLAILVDGSPYALIAPCVFGDFFRNPEDYYIKWPFGSLLRLIRLGGLMVTLLLPGMYIAIANFHQEMIPSSLLLAIAASRESVPFPAAYEVIMMEVAFEIIREGSLRIPTVLGQTVGIVGALILGQAAVQANIVSPILVIMVATTALGSFTIPNYSMSLPVRFGRFFFILFAASLGLYGIAAGLFLISAHAASLRSFGVPYLSPSGPRSPGSPDVVLRGPTFAMQRRPEMLHPIDVKRQRNPIMDWNPMAPDLPPSGPKGRKTNGQDPH